MTATGPSTMESRPCPLGCPADDRAVLAGRDRLHGLPGTFTVVQCRTCGLMRTNPRPTPAAMAAYYPESYGPYEATRVETGAGSHRSRWRTAIRQMFDFRSHALPPLHPGNLLEIGCASGGFLHEMAGKGWRVHGIEFSPDSAGRARRLGFDVYTGTVEDAPAPEEPFDLLAGWMVLEHLHEPVAALRKLRSWARPDARLALSTPNAASLDFRLFGDAWYALQLPTHLFHFTPTSLERVLAAAGWRMERVLHQRVLTNLVASTGLRMQDARPLRRPGVWLTEAMRSTRWGHFALYPLAAALAAAGHTGRMTVWARPSP